MKDTICRALALASAVLAVLAGCAAGPAGSARQGAGDGIFEGSAWGWRGPVRLRVRFAGGQTTGIEILEHADDPAIGGAAMEELLGLVLEYGEADLDAFSGATESGMAFLAALEDARLTARRARSARGGGPDAMPDTPGGTAAEDTPDAAGTPDGPAKPDGPERKTWDAKD